MREELQEKLKWDARQEMIAKAIEEEQIEFENAIDAITDSMDKQELIDFYESMIDSFVREMNKAEPDSGTKLWKKLWRYEIDEWGE